MKKPALDLKAVIMAGGSGTQSWVLRLFGSSTV